MGQWGDFTDEGDSVANAWGELFDEYISQYFPHLLEENDGHSINEEEFFQKNNINDFLKFASRKLKKEEYNFYKDKEERRKKEEDDDNNLDSSWPEDTYRNALGISIRALRGGKFSGLFNIEPFVGTTTLPKSTKTLPTSTVSTLRHPEFFRQDLMQQDHDEKMRKMDEKKKKEVERKKPTIYLPIDLIMLAFKGLEKEVESMEDEGWDVSKRTKALKIEKKLLNDNFNLQLEIKSTAAKKMEIENDEKRNKQ
jgi:hypothetical protein